MMLPNLNKSLIYKNTMDKMGQYVMAIAQLENQQGCEPFEGSNPSLSAIHIAITLTAKYP